MKYLLKILVSSLAVLITTYLMPGVKVDGYITALLVAVVLSIFNTFLRPVLVILTIQATVFSFGLFLLVINAFIILLVSHFVKGFTVDSFWQALIFSIVLSIVTSILEWIGKKTDQKKEE
jgi:putative membrane protein